MNGLRPQEMLEVLRALEASAGEGEKAVLATVVSLDCSVYSRAGSMGLFVEDSAGRAGVIAASEGPEALRRELEEAAASGRPRLCALDLAEDEPLLGYGLGDPGRIELFLEPVDARLRLELRAVRDALLKGEGLVWEVEIEGAALGRRGLYSSDHPSAKECYQALSPELVESAEAGVLRRVFLCPVAPMGKVLVFGSGPDAAGWRAISRSWVFRHGGRPQGRPAAHAGLGPQPDGASRGRLGAGPLPPSPMRRPPSPS